SACGMPLQESERKTWTTLSRPRGATDREKVTRTRKTRISPPRHHGHRREWLSSFPAPSLRRIVNCRKRRAVFTMGHLSPLSPSRQPLPREHDHALPGCHLRRREGSVLHPAGSASL